ncbi:MAG: hypothetical protein ACTSR3_06300 [Candidatus Helarchaeota archaeon]
MSLDSKFVIMLEISSGMSKRLPYSMESLRDDNIVAIMDEIHDVIWLWMGKNTGLVQRRGSMRAARSLKAYGHEVGPSIVGRKLKDVLDVRGDAIETDPEQKNRFETILNLFNQEFTLKYEDALAEYRGIGAGKSNIKYGLTTEQRDQLVKAALAAPTAGDDTRKIEQIVGDFRPSPPPESSTASVIPKYKQTLTTTKPITQSITVQKGTQIDESLIGEIKGSILMSSFLSKINEIFVGYKKNSDGSSTYTLEGPNGETCKYTIKESKINFLSGSWENINPSVKQEIQEMFLNRVKLIFKQ